MFWLLVWACISIHLIPRFDSNVNSACQERWYLKILARARQVESRRLSIANNSCPFYTVSPFFPLFLLFFYFLGVGVWCGCVYTDDLLHCKCFQGSSTSIYNPTDLYKSWPMVLQTWLQFSSDSYEYPFSQFSGVSAFVSWNKASLPKYLSSYIHQSNRSRMPMLDGHLPP